MFSPTTQSLGLLQLAQNTNIIAVFSHDIQQTVIHQISYQISNNLPTFQATLSTYEHCKWVMEIIGAGFKLAIDKWETMQYCYNIYQEWFVVKKYTPQPIRDHFDEFRSTCIDHLTQILTKREITSTKQNLFSKYCELCKHVVISIRTIGIRLRKKSDSMERMLRLMIGCVEDFCGVEWSPDDAIYSHEVASLLIKTFYEMWIENSQLYPDLWKIISKLHHHWIFIKPVAKEWIQVTTYIQKTYLDALYITRLENAIISVENEDYSFSLATPRSEMFLWLRFIHLCGNTANIPKPDVLELVETGFYQFTTQMLTYSTNKTVVNPPNSNTIFSLFFEPLSLPVIYLSHHTYYGAISTALKTLLLVFKSFIFTTTLEKSFLNKFYFTMACALDTQNTVVLSSVLAELPSLFQIRLPGIETIYPNVILAAERFSISPLTDKNEVVSVLESLRLIMLSFSFQRNKIQLFTVPRKSSTHFPFDNFAKKTYNILFNILKKTFNEDILNSIFICFNYFFMDYIPRPGDSSQINENSPEYVLDEFIKLLNANYVEWFDMLIKSGNHMSIIELLRTILHVAPKLSVPHVPLHQIFQIISTYVELNYKLVDVINEFLSIFALYFVKCQANLPPNHLVSSLRLSSKICSFFNDSSNAKPEIAKSFIFDILLITGIYYHSLPESYQQKTINENVLLLKFAEHNIPDPLTYFHVFLDEASVISFIELPWEVEDNVPKVLVITRSPYGRFCYIIRMLQETDSWNLIPEHFDLENFEPKQLKPEQPSIKFEHTKSFNIEQLKKIQPSPQKSRVLQPPTVISPKSMQNSKIFNSSSTTRLFAACCESTSFNRPTFSPLKITANLFNDLETFDKLSTRIPGNVTITNNVVTPHFILFIERLGSVAIASSHTGYLRRYSGDEYFLHRSTPEQEIVFNVPSIYPTPTNDNSIDDICIEWREMSTNTELPFLKDETQLHIVIEQTPVDIFRVVSNKEVGPMKFVQQINIDCLAPFITLTINAFIRKKENLRCLTSRRESIHMLKYHADTENTHGEIHVLFNNKFVEGINTTNLSFVHKETDDFPPVSSQIVPKGFSRNKITNKDSLHDLTKAYVPSSNRPMSVFTQQRHLSQKPTTPLSQSAQKPSVPQKFLPPKPTTATKQSTPPKQFFKQAEHQTNTTFLTQKKATPITKTPDQQEQLTSKKTWQMGNSSRPQHSTAPRNFLMGERKKDRPPS
ncbi:Rap-GAP domain-containing protein [Entamoeba marina]